MQLKRRHTMKRAFEFAEVRARGASITGRFLILATSPLPLGRAEEHSLFGIIATKRVGHAVCRNRLRRRVRELLRAHGDPLATGHYVVIIVRARAQHADYAALERDLLKLLRQHPGATTTSSPTC